MNNEPLALEMLKEQHRNTKRWFIVALVELIIILAIVGIFIWYISLPIDEVSIENDSGNANYIGNDMNGDLYNGENYTETQSNTQ